ncbi:MAG: caspase family protein [Pseudorhodoplanes sp.]|nr:caspase family protein [Pseudorhodoplanes sp.]
MLAVILIAAPVVDVHAEKRIALVIGNAAYQNTPALSNPVNDSEDLAASLKKVGFTVIHERNLSKQGMEAAITRFARLAQDADAAMFFYAGHGMQWRGLNYLVPVDARMEDEFNLNFELTKLDDILFGLERARGVKILVLDACRNNPLLDRLNRTSNTRDLGATRGLAKIESTRGMVIAYSTQINQVAIDGTGRNSPFTQALVKEVEEPGVEIGPMFRRVAARVNKATEGRQLPEMSVSLLGEFYFRARQPDGNAAVSSSSVIASVSPGEHIPLTVPKIETPNEPLPPEVPIDPQILHLVEAHPFFANAPSVMTRSLSIASSISWVTNKVPGTTQSDDDTTISWLRRGIIRSDSVNQGAVRHSGSVHRSSSRTTSVSAANGLFFLGYSAVSRTSGTMARTTLRLLAIDNIKGRIFPIEIGAQFSYDATYQMITTNFKDEYTQKESYQFLKKYDANRFHSRLTGHAYLLVCDQRNIWRKTKTANTNSQSKTLFFESLGSWISVDPIFPPERIVQDNVVQNGGTFSGSYILKSFSVIQ